MRAGVTGLAAGLGAALWVLGEAASAAPAGPLAAFASSEPPIAPKAWALDHRTWHGMAGWPAHLAGASGALKLAAVILIALAALMILHPGAFRRPAPYYLSPLRRAIAWISALLIGIGAPAALAALVAALAPDLVDRLTMDAGAAWRLMIGIALFCAFAWTMAGPGILNIRAALRFSHGALAGLSIFGTLALAVLLVGPLTDLAQLASVGNVMVAVDAGARAPGATYGWMLGSSMLVYGLGFAVAGALATSSAPQSMGPLPRAGGAAVGLLALLLMLLAGRGVTTGVARRIALAAPDVRALAGLPPEAHARPIVLLMGQRFGQRRFPPRQALAPIALAPDCAPATASGGPTPPAASDSNVASLAAARFLLTNEVSGRAARITACEAGMRARLFDPENARSLVLDDPAPARTGFFAFSWTVRGLLERPAGAMARRRLAALLDTTRYTLSADTREHITRILATPAPAPATVTGRLDVDRPSAWRIALAAGGDSASGIVPWLYAPRTDGQVLQYVVQATAPDAHGAFAFNDVPPGVWQLALLAPEGTDFRMLSALSIRGDPGQFSVPAASRRDLGTIRIRP